MNIGYELTPQDTLFFRGSEPLEAGQPVATPLFPPPVSVLHGALRTAYLRNNGISFRDYQKGNVANDVIEVIGSCGKPAPFSITAVLLKRNGKYYAPAPAHWYLDLPGKPGHSKDFAGKIIVSSVPMSDNNNELRILSSSGLPGLVLTEHEAVPLAGNWINIRLLAEPDAVLSGDDVMPPSELYSVESRVGIGIKANRVVEEGKLYSANHIRLHDDVSIIIASDKDFGLGECGILNLGGEQKKCRYEKLALLPQFPQPATISGYVNLAPIAAEESHLPLIIAAYKPVITAGWDLNTKFHKPTVSWFPAGSLFSEQINQSCIHVAYTKERQK